MAYDPELPIAARSDICWKPEFETESDVMVGLRLQRRSVELFQDSSAQKGNSSSARDVSRQSRCAKKLYM
jgi:hypothetical protein